jgi:hypothetical protein
VSYIARSICKNRIINKYVYKNIYSFAFMLEFYVVHIILNEKLELKFEFEEEIGKQQIKQKKKRRLTSAWAECGLAQRHSHACLAHPSLESHYVYATRARASVLCRPASHAR